MSSENSTLTKINHLIPILSILLILYGVIKLTVYYTFFHINILSYLDFTELLPSILRDLMYSVIAVFLLLLISRISGNKKRAYNKENIAGQSWIESFKLYIHSYGFISYAIILTALSLIVTLIMDRNGFYDWFYRYSYWLVISVVSIVARELAFALDKYDSFLPNDRTAKLLITGTLLTVLLGVNRGLDNHHNQETGINKNTSYIEIGNRKVQSTKAYYYIGKTKSSVFFYDTLNGRTDIYPNSIITKMSLKQDEY